MSSLNISYLENIIANLKKLFPEEDTGLLSKFDVLNPTTWPANSCQLKTFGIAEVIHLSKHFQEYIPQDPEDLPTQWICLSLWYMKITATHSQVFKC